jgi:hypothetical protein
MEGNVTVTPAGLLPVHPTSTKEEDKVNKKAIVAILTFKIVESNREFVHPDSESECFSITIVIIYGLHLQYVAPSTID